MALPGGLPFLRDWASPQRAADLVVVDPTGFIAPAGGGSFVVAAEDIVGDLYRSLRENVRVEIDVVRGTFRVWLQGTDVVASNGLDQALATTPAVSLDGEPFFEATFEELQGAVAYLCDPDGGTACLAYPLLGGCPVPPPCDGLAGIREALPPMVRGLTLTFLGDCPPWLAERCGSRWYYPTPGTPPILRMYYTVTVDLDVDDDALAAEVPEEYRGLWDALRRYGTAELRFTDAGSEVLLAVEPETPGCEAGTCAAGTNGDRWMEWTSFLPGERTTSWHSGNLRFRQVESSGASPAGHCSFRVEVESWIIDYLGVLFGVSSSMIQHGINEAIRPQRDEMCDRVALALDRLESALLGYVGMIPAADGPVLPFGEDTFRSLLADDVIDPVTARLLEGSAGASRGWWSAWTGPLTEWNEMAGGGQQFAFRDVDYSTAGGPLQVALDIRSDIDCDGWEDHRDGCPRFCQPSPSDLDGDTIWDACDLCPTDREPGRVAAWSERIDYIRAPGSRTRSTHDGDGDEAGERTLGVARIDCDGDTAIEARFGLRCSTGSAGFPDYGRLRCDGPDLACRPPMLPGEVVREYRMPQIRAMAAQGNELLALEGRDIDVYRLESDGALTFDRRLRPPREAHDLAVSGNTLLLADARGVSLLRANDGGLLGELEFCGRVRRVFAQGSRAYVVGLFQVMMIDISDPTDPVVLQRIGLLPDRDGGLRAYSTADCGGVDALLDRLCDATGACGAFGRAAAAHDGGRLFLHLFGTLHVLALREDLGADVLASLPVGLLTDLALDGAFVYGNGPGHRTMVIGEAADGSWIPAGEHDVTGWVSGVVEIGPWVIRADRGRVQVATRQ